MQTRTLFSHLSVLHRSTRHFLRCLHCQKSGHKNLYFQNQSRHKHWSLFQCRLSSLCSVKQKSSIRIFTETGLIADQSRFTCSSALYIRPDNFTNVAVVQVDLDLQRRLENLQELEKNVKARGLNKDIKVYEFVSFNFKFLNIHLESLCITPIIIFDCLNIFLCLIKIL